VMGPDLSSGTPDQTCLVGHRTCPVRAEFPERESLEQLARLAKYITWSIDHILAQIGHVDKTFTYGILDKT
jgi:hypothetical protein